jgi:hypothetical protein
MEGSSEYKQRISSRRQPIRGGLPAWGLGVGLTTHLKKISLLRNVTKVLGPSC